MMQITLPDHQPLTPGQPPVGRRPRLLIVGDEPVNIQAPHRVFSQDCQVLMATDGARALQLCRERQPDLVLLDVQMPGMSGHELCPELKADLLRELAFVDGLTGVHNRRHFDERLQAESRRSQRSRAPLAVVLADVDHFKRYNDALGHLAGDDCLRRVAAALRTCLRRPTDLLARYGGEEFVCPGIDGCVMVSLGVTASALGSGLVEAADWAPYLAKAAGCGRVSWVET